MSDLTRLLQTLQPSPDGESAVRHRTALVDAVNSDGTVDLDFDGTIVPSVSVLDGAAVAVGSVVQVAAWAGDLLVLGVSASSAAAFGWTNWTPAYGGTLTIGNGTVVARYMEDRGLVTARFEFTLGSGSAVGSNPTVSMPVTASSTGYSAQTPVGVCHLLENGVQLLDGAVQWNTSTTFSVRRRVVGPAGIVDAAVTATAPFTWGTGDKISFIAIYEKA